MRWVEHVTRAGDREGAYRVLVEIPEEKKTLLRRRRRWKDNINMDLEGVVWRDTE
jgi:hypothetical protein